MTEYEKMVAGEWIATDDAEIVRRNRDDWGADADRPRLRHIHAGTSNRLAGAAQAHRASPSRDNRRGLLDWRTCHDTAGRYDWRTVDCGGGVGRRGRRAGGHDGRRQPRRGEETESPKPAVKLCGLRGHLAPYRGFWYNTQRQRQ